MKLLYFNVFRHCQLGIQPVKNVDPAISTNFPVNTFRGT